MTVVTFHIEVPDPQGVLVPARGYLNFVPTTALNSGTTDILPLEFTVPLVDGEASADLLPTGIGWAWSVNYRILGYTHYSKTYAVPDVPTIDFRSLVELDWTTLEPDATPDPAWYGWVDQIVQGQVGVVAVTTGNEPRPAFPAVLWIGGITEPVNMADLTDIWFKATP